MIITRTPYRISFFGGGTDYSTWYEKHGGAVLSTTINHHCYISLRHMPAFLGSKYRIFWSKMESVDRIEDIEHAGVRGCLQYLNMDDGIEVNHAGDLPARSGLGSSSAFTVGMLYALHTLRCERVRKHDLAQEAIKVEQEVLGETVGIQDQIQCAFGGLNHLTINKDGTYDINRIFLHSESQENLESHLLLAFTGLQRYASEIAADQVANFDRKQKQLERIQAMVPEAVGALNIPKEFGEMLHETWMLKRELSDKITNPEIDEIYETARNKGAIGGKILGAGGGGFILLFVPPEKREAVMKALGLLYFQVEFDLNGSQIVLR